MSIFQQRFSTGQVVTATDLPNATLQSWLKRNLIIGHKDIAGGGSPGIHRTFSFFNVMEIAIAKALTDLGLSASDALKAGQRFAHGASGPIGMGPSRRPSIPFDSREVGCMTLLCIAGDKSITYRMTKAENGLFAEARSALGWPGGFIVLEIGPIFERATRRLGYDYRAVLADAYDYKS